MKIMELLERYVAAYERDVQGRVDTLRAQNDIAESMGRAADAQAESARVAREGLARPHQTNLLDVRSVEQKLDRLSLRIEALASTPPTGPDAPTEGK